MLKLGLDNLRQRIALIVDDDPIIQMVVGQYLRSHHGFDILVAGNGREAGRLVESADGGIALVVCDVHMPDYDGIEFIGYLHARGSKYPVVFVTGAHPAIVNATLFLAKAKGLPVLGLLKKPIDLVKLSSLVALLDEMQSLT